MCTLPGWACRFLPPTSVIAFELPAMNSWSFVKLHWPTRMNTVPHQSYLFRGAGGVSPDVLLWETFCLGKVRKKIVFRRVIVRGEGVTETKSHQTETWMDGYHCLANTHSANGTLPLTPTASLVPTATLKRKYHHTHLSRKKADLERLSKSSRLPSYWTSVL